MEKLDRIYPRASSVTKFRKSQCQLFPKGQKLKQYKKSASTQRSFKNTNCKSVTIEKQYKTTISNKLKVNQLLSLNLKLRTKQQYLSKQVQKRIQDPNSFLLLESLKYLKEKKMKKLDKVKEKIRTRQQGQRCQKIDWIQYDNNEALENNRGYLKQLDQAVVIFLKDQDKYNLCVNYLQQNLEMKQINSQIHEIKDKIYYFNTDPTKKKLIDLRKSLEIQNRLHLYNLQQNQLLKTQLNQIKSVCQICVPSIKDLNQKLIRNAIWRQLVLEKLSVKQIWNILNPHNDNSIQVKRLTDYVIQINAMSQNYLEQINYEQKIDKKQFTEFLLQYQPDAKIILDGFKSVKHLELTLQAKRFSLNSFLDSNFINELFYNYESILKIFMQKPYNMTQIISYSLTNFILLDIQIMSGEQIKSILRQYMGSYTVLTKSSESKLDKEIQKLIKPYYKDLQDTLRAYDSESSGYV